MIRLADAVALASAACAVAALLLALPGVAWLRRKLPAVSLLVAMALALVPQGALSAAGYVRGAVGDLSVTTTVLLVHFLLRPVLGLRPIAERSRIALQGLVALGSVLVYPAVLGFGWPDAYRLGFAHLGFLCALLLVAIAAWLARLHLVASALALAVLAWAVGTGESRNLWDYLLDPLVAAWGLAGLALQLGRPRAAKSPGR